MQLQKLFELIVIAIWLLNDELKYVMAKKYGLDSLFTVFPSNSDNIEFILYFFLKISSIYEILVTNERATKSCYHFWLVTRI